MEKVVIPTGLVLLMIVAAVFLSSLAPVTAQKTAETLDEVSIPLSFYQVDGLEVVDADHGVDRHNADYVLTVQTCTNNGSGVYYLEDNREKLHFLCTLPDGRTGDLVTTVKKGAKYLYENTAFARPLTMTKAIDMLIREHGATPIRKETILKWLFGGK